MPAFPELMQELSGGQLEVRNLARVGLPLDKFMPELPDALAWVPDLVISVFGGLAGSDGAEFLVQAPQRFASLLLAVLGLPASLPRADIAAAAAGAAATDPAAAWLQRLWAAGIPAAPVRPPSDEVPRPAWSFDGVRPGPAAPPPALGAHDGQGWHEGAGMRALA